MIVVKWSQPQVSLYNCKYVILIALVNIIKLSHSIPSTISSTSLEDLSSKFDLCWFDQSSLN